MRQTFFSLRAPFSLSLFRFFSFAFPFLFTQALLASFFSLFIPLQASNSLPSSYFGLPVHPFLARLFIFWHDFLFLAQLLIFGTTYFWHDFLFLARLLIFGTTFCFWHHFLFLAQRFIFGTPFYFWRWLGNKQPLTKCRLNCSHGYKMAETMVGMTFSFWCWPGNKQPLTKRRLNCSHGYEMAETMADSLDTMDKVCWHIAFVYGKLTDSLFVAKLQNTGPLICISLNLKGSFCFCMSRSKKLQRYLVWYSKIAPPYVHRLNLNLARLNNHIYLIHRFVTS